LSDRRSPFILRTMREENVSRASRAIDGRLASIANELAAIETVIGGLRHEAARERATRRLAAAAYRRARRVAEPALYAWLAASVSLGVILLVVRLSSGPVHGYGRVVLLVWTAPLWVAAAGVVAGAVGCVVWLGARLAGRSRG
jgi:hypothetical protein